MHSFWLPTIPPLTAEQQRLVSDNLYHLDHFFVSRRFRHYVRRLGRDEAYQFGAMSFMRAAVTYHPPVPFHFYAAFWLRHFLTMALRRLIMDRATLEVTEYPHWLRDRQPSPAEQASQRDSVAVIRARLPRRLMKAITLRSEGYLLEEIGEALGVRKSRARQLCLCAVAVARGDRKGYAHAQCG